MEALLAEVREAAAALGLSRIAVASARALPDAALFDAWLARGDHAGMAWLARHRDAALDPQRLLPGARSILCAAWSHARGAPPVAPGSPRIARYAWGADYHAPLRARLRALAAHLRARLPGVRTRVAVDTAPVLERHWAAQSGLGWIGRNGNLIVPGAGSWVFLGEILLDADLPAGEPLAGRCGACRRCLEVCPGGALREDRPMDARRCIAYWTIEHRGPFPERRPPRLSPWLFGCDQCQEVCPWNRDLPRCAEPGHAAVLEALRWQAEAWEALDEENFRARFAGTSFERSGYQGILRNMRSLRAEGWPPG